MEHMVMHVEAFGKIQKADIEMAPMVFFIGDNNSGKSYLMTLLYGLSNLSLQEYIARAADSVEYRHVCDLFRPYINLGEETCRVDVKKDDFNSLIRFYNYLLYKYKNEIIEDIFNKKVEIGEIKIEIPYKRLELVIERREQPEEYDEDETPEVYDYAYRIGIIYRRRKLWINRSFKGSDLRESILEFIIARLFRIFVSKEMTENLAARPLFLPVSRTGFMLTYKTLAGSSIEDKFNSTEEQKNLLTRPESDFLRKLSGLTARDRVEIHKGREMELVQYIQDEIIDGSITISKLPLADIMYSPNSRPRLSIPLFLSSGVVTEMAPLLAFLEAGNRFNLLMMEEPEMCMHPQLQRRVARLLIRIAHSGTHVAVTTHSDIILQHINSMIMLSNHTEKQKLMSAYGYEEQDLLLPHQVAVYEFKADGQRSSEIQRLTCGAFGFPVPTFSDALETILEEARAFVEEDE